MSEITFFLKTFVLTVAVVLVMQIQVGESSLESHTMSWVQTSAIVAPINAAAEGGAKVVRDFITYVHAQLDKRKGKHKKEEVKATSTFRWDYIRNNPSKTEPKD
jgi:hypothetical protein